MIKVKKSIVVIQIVLNILIFAFAFYLLKEFGIFEQDAIVAVICLLLVIFMFLLNNVIYFKNYKKIKKGENNE